MQMPSVSGAMRRWWFAWCDAGYNYKLWHPEDPVRCTWDARPGEAPADARGLGYKIGRAFSPLAEDLVVQFQIQLTSFLFRRSAPRQALCGFV
mmetsp:Transcript_143160/g.457632  ORF Transcript_143160/g.457632 Transcript_143160/m.457632 type:complete len:93 (+) Transcript_143160:331-609(+)